MDSSIKSACFDEISHLILDNGKKVNTKLISNNWDVKINVASLLLEEWFTKNEKKGEFTKEYLVKGSDENGNGLVTIIPESKLKALKKKFKWSEEFLYSIETFSNSSRKLNITEHSECKMINLLSENEERILATPQKEPIPEATIIPKKELSSKTVASLFGQSSQKKETTKVNEATTSKVNDIETRKVDDTIENIKLSPKTPIKKESPTKLKVSPKSKDTPKKKDSKKEIQKNSIASFFSASSNKPKSSTSSSNSSPVFVAKPKKENNVSLKIEKPVEKEIILNENSKSSKVKCEEKLTPSESIKRTISNINGDDGSTTEDEIIPSTPQEKIKKPAKKKQKTESTKKNSNTRKLSRIIDPDTSSDEEQENLKIEDVKKTPEKNPQVINGNGNNHEVTSRPKNKAKRVVSRAYEDSDGFIRTVKEIEEYSCSDEEPNDKINGNNNEKKEEKVEEKKPIKKAVPQKATKQGNIMSFFSKK